MASPRISRYLPALALCAAAAMSAPASAAPAPASASGTTPSAATANLPGNVLDQVVAVVNDQPILESSLDEEMSRVRSSLQSRGTPIPPEKVFRHQVLEHLITQSLELQAAKQQGIQVSDDDVNRALSRIAQNNGITLAKLPKALAARGGDYAAFRRMIHDQLVIHQLEQQQVAANVDVSPAEIKHYLQTQERSTGGNTEYHIAQILIPFPSNPSPKQVNETLAKAKAIVRKVRNGANFAQTAVAQSAGPHALKGGDIGWLKAAQLPTLFTSAVPKMKSGQISDPIEGAGGYHIVKLIATRQPKGNQSVTTEFHVEHIMLRPNPVRNLAQCKALAEKLRKKIESGKLTFAAAAKQYSDDPNSAGNGGDLGWKAADQLPPKFAQAVAKLPKDKLSQPVKTQYGWHLIEVLGTRKQSATKEQKRHQAYQAIFQRKLADQLAEFKRNLHDSAYIKILDAADTASNSSGQ